MNTNEVIVPEITNVRPITIDSAAEIARLKRELEALKSSSRKPKMAVTFKVSPKGAVSVYGLGRFPVTLYAEQWKRLLSDKDSILAFIDANVGRLSFKGED